jgi:twinkle protein
VETDPDSRAIVFPSYSPAGELVNRSYRTIPAKPEQKKHVWQDTGCAPSLFGWQALTPAAYASRRILLTEGQIDAMTWHQWGIPALSIPNGSGQTWVEYEWDNLAAFDEILIAFDMDGAGREIARKTIARLGLHRCLIVTIDKGKDPNEALLNGVTAEAAQQWLEHAAPPVFTGLVRAIDIQNRVEALCNIGTEAWTLPFFRKEWPDSGLYFRPGEVTLWTGVSSHGKSTFLGFLIMSALCKGHKSFIASMEVKAEKTVFKMIKATCKKPTPSPADVGGFLELFGPELILADRIGYVEQKDLFDMMRFAYQRYGCTHFMIDSLMRIAGLSEEYTKQAEFMNELQVFAKETDAHIHLVAHPRKLGTDGKPALMDIKGSSDIPNNADNVVAVCRNMEKMDKLRDPSTTASQLAAMWDTEIRVEKQRESGWAGAFQLRFDIRTGVFSLMTDAITVPQTYTSHNPF